MAKFKQVLLARRGGDLWDTAERTAGVSGHHRLARAVGLLLAVVAVLVVGFGPDFSASPHRPPAEPGVVTQPSVAPQPSVRAGTALTVGAVPLWPVPGAVIRACRQAQARASFPVLCPARLPRASRGDLAWDSPSPLEVTRSPEDLVFGYSAEAAGLGPAQALALDGPDRFLHLVIGLATQGVPPGARRARLGGHWGMLAPASSVENYAGAYFANHVRFVWREHGVAYLATLHTFGAHATTALLGRIVAGLVPAGKLGVADQRLARAAVSPAPAALAANGTGVWVGTRGDNGDALNGQLVHIDPLTMRTDRRALIPPKGIRVAVGAGAVWALSYDVSADGQSLTPPQLTRIDPISARVTGHLALGPGEASAIAVAPGAVWVATIASDRHSSGTVLQIDPATLRVRTRAAVGRGPASLAIGDGSVWAVNAAANTVSRLDAGTGRVAATVPIGRHPFGIAVGRGAVWVANVDDGTVSRIDASSNRITATIQVGRAPYGVATDSRGVWVAMLGSGVLVRIDPQTNRLAERVDVHGDPLALATAGARLFATVNTDGLVLRLAVPANRPGSR